MNIRKRIHMEIEMTIEDNYNSAVKLAADALGCTTEQIHAEAKKRGFEFMYSGNQPVFKLARRLDTYSPEDVVPIWKYLGDGTRLYFDSLNHSVDPDAI